MVKSRILPFMLAGFSFLLLLLAIIFSYAPTIDAEPVQIFAATVNQDCAPWDGAAFTIKIAYDPVSTIQVSIWGLPNTSHSATFDFPDETGRVGHAALHTSSVEALSGHVSLGAVEEGRPIEGAFNLVTEAGTHLRGKFIAIWGDFVALCG
jgi:hypothetical protein